MITINYSNFETPTGSWFGNQDSAPEVYQQYQPIASSVVGVEKPNGIITFEDLPANLKIVAANEIDLPFDRIYVDIDGYANYVMMDADQDGNYVEAQAGNGFIASYTSGGFWLMGDDDTDTPGVILMAEGSAPTSSLDILNLTWEPIAAEIDNSHIENYGGSPYLNLNYSSHIIHYTTPQTMPAFGDFVGFIFNKNEYSWQKKIFIPSSSFSNFIDSSTGVLIVNAPNNSKSFTFSGSAIAGADAVAFWWEGNDLTGQVFSSSDSIDTPLPFQGSVSPNTGSYLQYAGATVYPEEPMISYDVIDDHTIQITSDIDSLIPPLKKLYLNFSGIAEPSE